MTIARQQAIESTPKRCERVTARRARRVALAQAFRCRAKGELEGFEVWLQVRDALKRQAAGAAEKVTDGQAEPPPQ